VHQLTNISVDQLNPWKRNARTHSRKQIRQIANAIKEFGFVNPVIVDTENNILAGHGRLEAAKLLGMEGVPCLVIPHMTAAQKRAYVLADNKLVLNGGYDEEPLATELKELLAADLTFDIDVTGFSIPEIDSLVENLEPIEDGDPAEDRLPDPAACKPRCRPASSRTSSSGPRTMAVWARFIAPGMS
jgi:ParB-like chromosome segregation protein Spo0J